LKSVDKQKIKRPIGNISNHESFLRYLHPSAITMSRRFPDCGLQNGVSDSKRPRLDISNNRDDRLNENSENANLAQNEHTNGINSKCSICLWPLHSPRCYHTSSDVSNGLANFAHSNGQQLTMTQH